MSQWFKFKVNQTRQSEEKTFLHQTQLHDLSQWTKYSPLDFWLNLVVAIQGCHDEWFLDSSLLGLSVSESLSLGRLFGVLNLWGSKMSLTVNDVTACLVSWAESSSFPERSCASSASLLKLPLLLVSMREIIENRSLPCILLRYERAALNKCTAETCFAPFAGKRAQSYETFGNAIGGGLNSVSILQWCAAVQ